MIKKYCTRITNTAEKKAVAIDTCVDLEI